MNTVSTGLECFINSPPKWLKGHRLGILCNPASVDRSLLHARDLIHNAFPDQITALFSPQHGFYSDKQDNMVESSDMVDTVLKIPVYSLYSHSRIPTRQMFDRIDTLIIDLQDVGTRVYTFATTVSYCLEAARDLDKQVVLLDRPNPLGGVAVEGNCLMSDVASFVGRYPIPMRHGMTMGELSTMINQHFGVGCSLHVVKMNGWDRRMHYPDTGLPWVAPSPNLPTFHSAMVYPGQVVWEGTNVSEGRGTTQPFEYFGAPYIEPDKLRSFLKGNEPPGIILREIAFEPTSNKWTGLLCRGFQVHVVNPDLYKPYETTLFILQAVLACHEQDFEWKSPPYEYEYDKLPIDLIIGDKRIRKRIEKQDSLQEIVESWETNLKSFQTFSKDFYLYK
jgi:uncharacterized protein YbbC (DUF1343 family)